MLLLRQFTTQTCYLLSNLTLPNSVSLSLHPSPWLNDLKLWTHSLENFWDWRVEASMIDGTQLKIRVLVNSDIQSAAGIIQISLFSLFYLLSSSIFCCIILVCSCDTDAVPPVDQGPEFGIRPQQARNLPCTCGILLVVRIADLTTPLNITYWFGAQWTSFLHIMGVPIECWKLNCQ